MTRPAAVVATLAAVLLLGACSDGAGRTPSESEPAGPARSSAAPEPPGVRIGEPVWATRTSGLEVPQLLGAGDDVLLVGDVRGGGESSLQVLDADSGRRLWRLRDDDGDGSSTYYAEPGVEVGRAGSGRYLVTVPYEQYTCPATGDPDDCVVEAGIEARDARSGEVPWRWRASGTDSSDGFVTGAVVTEQAVLVPRRGGTLGLDPTTGERAWWADVQPPGAVEGDVGVSGPAAGGDGPYRVLDLASGDTVRSIDPDEAPAGPVGDVLALPDGDAVRLEDARSGRVLGSVDGGEVPPLALRADGGLAWRVAGDRLVSLVPGEAEPVVTRLPEEVASADTALAHFAGGVDGGVWFVLVDGVVRTVGRDGAVDDDPGPEAVTVRSVSGRTLVLQVGTELVGPEPAVAVRRIH
ncbi:hypothetical protein [uncultured Nocardioides sp.]|uniref:hypothetical protein n=1 Tax=uncultured Nocardioides sp. TaxID=198441 RepID=UPI002639E07A|nr:hypothetical protein [uncultured Nocardioides sp.]